MSEEGGERPVIVPLAKIAPRQSAGESSYRRGFIHGIQFALNSMQEGATREQIKDDQQNLHWHWRTKLPNDVFVSAPISSGGMKQFLQNDLPQARRLAAEQAGKEGER